MTRTALAFLLGATALLPSALAQDFAGNYELEGRYSTGKKTSVELKIRPAGSGFAIERQAKLLSAAGAVTGQAAWTCTQARRVSPQVVRATYRLEPAGGLNTVLGGIDPAASDDDLAAALGQTNVFEALYVLGADQKSLREVVVNTTRLNGERWRQLIARGERVTSAQPGPLSAAALEEKVQAALKRWHADYTNDTYESLLAEADPGERQNLLAQRARDLDFSNNDVSSGDDLFEELVDDRYGSDDGYLRADGSRVERQDVRVYSLSMFPEHAGIGLSISFAFDARTGELLEEGEIVD